MIREALQYLVGLAQDSDEIVAKEILGGVYTKEPLIRINQHIDMCEIMKLSNLDSLISSVRSVLKNHSLPLTIQVGANRVDVYSHYNGNKEREHIFNTIAETPDIRFNGYVSVEAMIIQLQTCFVESLNQKNLIALLSKLTKENSVEMNDDGISQRVTIKEGISSSVVIPPLVKLTPFRTFFEVEQPEQMFLFRINKNGEVALFDAGGGVWKNDCQSKIKEYLSKSLNDIIDQIIIG